MAGAFSFNTASARPSAAATNITTVTAEGSDTVTIPGGGFLLDAEFHRAGPDLVLVGEDGRQVVVVGYFAQATPPMLMTASGAVVPPDLAAKLAGPIAPGQFAQASDAQHLAVVGKVDKLTGTVEVIHPDGTRGTLNVDDVIYKGDVIATKPDGTVGITFADSSTFALGKAGRMVIDELVYDPAAQSGQSTLSVVKGTFSFVSGQIAKTAPNGTSIKTPVMTIGVRGTSVAGTADSEGSQNTVVLLQDPDGNVGQISITNAGGTVVINQPNMSVSLTSFIQPPPPPIYISPQQIRDTYQNVMEAHSLPPQPSTAPPTGNSTGPQGNGGAGGQGGTGTGTGPDTTGGGGNGGDGKGGDGKVGDGKIGDGKIGDGKGGDGKGGDGGDGDKGRGEIKWIDPIKPDPVKPDPIKLDIKTGPVDDGKPKGTDTGNGGSNGGPITGGNNDNGNTGGGNTGGDGTGGGTGGGAPGSSSSGRAIDGYVKGATVYRDLHNLGTRDADEPSTTTDDHGNYTLPGSGGIIVVTGGTDTVTGKPFLLTMKAPDGATVVTPLTTMVVAVMAANPGVTADQAQDQVKDLLGVDAAGSLLSVNPIAEMAGSDGAKAMMAAIAQMATTINALVAATSGTATPLSAQSVLAALVNKMTAGTPINLTDKASLESLVAATGATLDPTKIEALTLAVRAANISLGEKIAYAGSFDDVENTIAATVSPDGTFANTLGDIVAGNLILTDVASVHGHLAELKAAQITTFDCSTGSHDFTAAEAAGLQFNLDGGAEAHVVDDGANLSANVGSLYRGFTSYTLTGGDFHLNRPELANLGSFIYKQGGTVICDLGDGDVVGSAEADMLAAADKFVIADGATVSLGLDVLAYETIELVGDDAHIIAVADTGDVNLSEVDYADDAVKIEARPGTSVILNVEQWKHFTADDDLLIRDDPDTSKFLLSIGGDIASHGIDLAQCDGLVLTAETTVTVAERSRFSAADIHHDGYLLITSAEGNLVDVDLDFTNWDYLVATGDVVLTDDQVFGLNGQISDNGYQVKMVVNSLDYSESYFGVVNALVLATDATPTISFSQFQQVAGHILGAHDGDAAITLRLTDGEDTTGFDLTAISAIKLAGNATISAEQYVTFEDHIVNPSNAASLAVRVADGVDCSTLDTLFDGADQFVIAEMGHVTLSLAQWDALHGIAGEDSNHGRIWPYSATIDIVIDGNADLTTNHYGIDSAPNIGDVYIGENTTVTVRATQLNVVRFHTPHDGTINVLLSGDLRAADLSLGDTFEVRSGDTVMLNAATLLDLYLDDKVTLSQDAAINVFGDTSQYPPELIAFCDTTIESTTPIAEVSAVIQIPPGNAFCLNVDNPDGDPVSYSVGASAFGGSLVEDSPGTFSYSPPAGPPPTYHNVDVFSVTITVGSRTVTQRVALMVGDSGDAPNLAAAPRDDISVPLQGTWVSAGITLDGEYNGDVTVVVSLRTGTDAAHGLLRAGDDNSGIMLVLTGPIAVVREQLAQIQYRAPDELTVSGTDTIHVAISDGTNIVTESISFTAAYAAPEVFTGNQSDAWSTPGNWIDGDPPTTGSEVNISGDHDAIMTRFDSATLARINIAKGASLVIEGALNLTDLTAGEVDSESHLTLQDNGSLTTGGELVIRGQVEAKGGSLTAYYGGMVSVENGLLTVNAGATLNLAGLVSISGQDGVLDNRGTIAVAGGNTYGQLDIDGRMTFGANSVIALDVGGFTGDQAGALQDTLNFARDEQEQAIATLGGTVSIKVDWASTIASDKEAYVLVDGVAGLDVGTRFVLAGDSNPYATVRVNFDSEYGQITAKVITWNDEAICAASGGRDFLFAARELGTLFTGVGANDVVVGGNGYDQITVTSDEFDQIDGGDGYDTLVLGTAGTYRLDDASIANVERIQIAEHDDQSSYRVHLSSAHANLVDGIQVNDEVYGGNAADTFVVTTDQFASIDGGDGSDTLAVLAADWDLSVVDARNIETLAINTHDNTAAVHAFIDADGVMDMTTDGTLAVTFGGGRYDDKLVLTGDWATAAFSGGDLTFTQDDATVTVAAPEDGDLLIAAIDRHGDGIEIQAHRAVDRTMPAYTADDYASDYIRGAHGEYNDIRNIGDGDTVYGGHAGNTFTLATTDFATISGGEGEDTLVLNGGTFSLGTPLNTVSGMDIIKLESATLMLRADAFNGSQTIQIIGQEGATLRLDETWGLVEGTDASYQSTNGNGQNVRIDVDTTSVNIDHSA